MWNTVDEILSANCRKRLLLLKCTQLPSSQYPSKSLESPCRIIINSPLCLDDIQFSSIKHNFTGSHFSSFRIRLRRPHRVGTFKLSLNDRNKVFSLNVMFLHIVYTPYSTTKQYGNYIIIYTIFIYIYVCVYTVYLYRYIIHSYLYVYNVTSINTYIHIHVHTYYVVYKRYNKLSSSYILCIKLFSNN